jgi:hypothetical protein
VQILQIWILTNPDDVYRAEIRSFPGATTETVRYDPLCPVIIKPVAFDNLREGIAMILVKKFRAGIPACPAADTCHAVDSHVHQVIPYMIPQIVGFSDKGMCSGFFSQIDKPIPEHCPGPTIKMIYS